MGRDVTSLLPPWIRELTPYPPGKPIDELEREYGITGSIKLASNENPLGPSPRAIEALRGAIADVHRYPDGGTFHLRRRLAEKFGMRPEQFIVGNGSNEIIELIVRAFVRPGDEVIMADQAFLIYRMVVQAAAATPRVVPLKNYTHDLEAIAAAVNQRTRVVFLANPNNPTGTIYTRDDWEEFLTALPQRVLIVADDAYAEYVDDPLYPDSLAYHREGRLLVTLRTFSKIYGLAGLRVGYGVTRSDIVDALHRIRQPFNVNALAQVAARAALDDDDHVDRTRATNREGMAFLRAACERLGLPVVPSRANFLLVDVDQGAEVYGGLLRQGVIVRPMVAYRFPRHIRVSVGTMEENRRFVTALERVLSGTKAPGSAWIPEPQPEAAGAAPRPESEDQTGGRAQPLFARMAVIGVGLIGGSLALAARRAGLVTEVVGCGRNAENLRTARSRSLVDTTTQDPGEAVRGAGIVVLAVPVGAMEAVAHAIRPHLAPGTIVTDVASVKEGIVASLESLCAQVKCPFVGAHPIAGTADAGADAADAALFRERLCIITPTAATDPAALGAVRALWEGVGMRVEQMDAGTHDKIMARVSHAPHLIAYALASAVGEVRTGDRGMLAYAGSGFQDTTRIAASPATLWREIALANREQVLEALEEFHAHLRTLEELIRKGDEAGLERALGTARQHRRSLTRTEAG
jgi:histidinol-phosphate aminotransferase